MKWNELKKIVDAELKHLNKDDIDIFYIDTGNYPDSLKVSIDEFDMLIVQ